MKQIVPFGLAAVTTLFLFGNAQAADLSQPVPEVKAPVAVPQLVPFWTGFYAGINGGVGAGKYDYSAVIGGVPVTGSLDSSGGFFGGQIGYNYQFHRNWVAGLEADLEASDIQGRFTGSADPYVTVNAGTKTNFFGTVRARIGYLVTPSALLYATGGWAYGENTSSLQLDASYFNPGIVHHSSDTHYKSGWTIGGGLEYALNPNLSAKVEYQYMDLGSNPIASGNLITTPILLPGTISEKTIIQTIRVGLNYKFGGGLRAGAVVDDAAPMAPVKWTGLYVGANGGVGGNKVDYPFNIGGYMPSASLTSSGGFGGAQIGYNYQFAPAWVVGAEADIDGSNIEGLLKASALGGSLAVGTKLDWFGSVRGRVGYLLTPSALLYGTGGWAFGHTTSSITLDPIGSISRGHDKSGWTVGAGLEYALTPHLSAKAEYLYQDLGTDVIGSIPSTASLSETTTVNIVKAGLNYRF